MAKNTNLYRFTAVVDPYNDEEILVQFLKHKKDGITEKDKVFGATTGYWRPFAYKVTQNLSETELKQYARTAIYQLQQHINYIARSFGLEESLLMAAQANENKVSIPNPVVQPLLEQMKPNAQILPDAQTEPDDLLIVDAPAEPELTQISYESLLSNDDAIFENLFPVEH